MDAVYAHKSGARNRVKVNDLMGHDTSVVAQLVRAYARNAEGLGFDVPVTASNFSSVVHFTHS